MNRGLRLDQQQYDALQKRTKGGDAHANGLRNTQPVQHVTPAGRMPDKTRSYLEEMLAQHIKWAALPVPEREYLFHRTRKWRIDFAWGVFRSMQYDLLAVEVQGEVHRIKSRFDRDIEKIQALTLAGWRYLPISSKDVRSGRAIELIEKALKL